ncbi:hypothetical protein AGQ02_004401 [Salmonella enterica subsp. enterica serovar Takoradi]|uniref:Uncharacterized protein n=4 Tax=Salmonella enterica I TaxID=59201 RepID=A0A629CCL7_SALET|nr:hypothetical protein [Salmonella enterica]EAA7927506.1 hypothetical protein [Salmonella enterica subsp. enterica serovar Kottbus]EBV4049008.1 hypothetical protein [Salmonella enterica subsp. enterica serovar Braenderup]EBW6363782.1 hypothetical protein [Salmonella enterica subsp. enterica serovar Oranienburg]EBW8258091.1 hypothetical protein [Salmonella enterica subsp. enterica serovar Ohio]EBY4406390.1 hypothetical protein [Salmonella enterica subsp. enterica serovar Brunei]EBZ9516221.1 h
MNNQRRKWISEISNKLAALKDDLSNVLDEEQEYFDNMPVSFQSGSNGEISQMAISSIDNALCHIEDAIYSLSEVE